MSSAMTDPYSGPINRAATFHPSRNDDELPAVEVAGVLVFAYVDATGTLRVSLDFDTADSAVFGEDADGACQNVPVLVTLSGQAVYGIDRNGVDHFADEAEAFADDVRDDAGTNVDRTAVQMGRFSDAPDEDCDGDDAPTGRTDTCRHCGDVIAETGDYDWTGDDGHLGCPARDSSKPHEPSDA